MCPNSGSLSVNQDKKRADATSLHHSSVTRPGGEVTGLAVERLRVTLTMPSRIMLHGPNPVALLQKPCHPGSLIGLLTLQRGGSYACYPLPVDRRAGLRERIYLKVRVKCPYLQL